MRPAPRAASHGRSPPPSDDFAGCYPCGSCLADAERRGLNRRENRTIDSKQLAQAIARTVLEKQAEDVTILDVSGPLVIADYFVIATARNTRHARALARDIDAVAKAAGGRRRSSAGVESESSWVLLDYDEVVVHLFLAEARAFYDLESLWADVPRLPLEASPRAGDLARARE